MGSYAGSEGLQAFLQPCLEQVRSWLAVCLHVAHQPACLYLMLLVAANTSQTAESMLFADLYPVPVTNMHNWH